MEWKFDVTSPSHRSFRIINQRSHLLCSAPVYHESSSSPGTAKKSLQNVSGHKILVTIFPSQLVIYSKHFSSFITAVTLKTQCIEVPVKNKGKAIAAWPRSLLPYSVKISLSTPSSLAESRKGYQLLAMASHGSSSESGPTVEERIESLENTMGRLRARVDKQDKLLQATNQVGEQTWDILNEDIRKLRADHSASIGNLEDFKEELHTSFKDVANTQGDFVKRISALETAVSKLLAKLDK